MFENGHIKILIFQVNFPIDFETLLYVVMGLSSYISEDDTDRHDIPGRVLLFNSNIILFYWILLELFFNRLY